MGGPMRGEAGRRNGGRPVETEDFLNRFIYHPLSYRLALLLRPTGITPNAVSVLGGLLVVAAALAYTGYGLPHSVLLGFACHLTWHVVDGADGDLARMTGKASATGELVDGLCDYLSHIVLYVVLAIYLDDTLGGWAWAAAWAAGLSHILQSNHAESQRRNYLWWALGKPWIKHTSAPGAGAPVKRSWIAATFGWLGWLYIRLAGATNPYAGQLDAIFADAANDPARLAVLRETVRSRMRACLTLQHLVGANPRAFLLAASMALGSSLYYFLGEAILLNALLVVSVIRHRQVCRDLVETLRR